RITGIPLPSPKQRNSDISDRVNDGIIKGMGLEPYERTQTVREWLEFVMSIQLKSPVIHNQSSKSQLKSSQVFPITQEKTPISQEPSRVSPKNTPEKIQTRKFEFEYAKIKEVEEIVNPGFLGIGRKTEINVEIKRYHGQAEEFTEDLGNGVILKMVKIPGGSFIMGSPEDEKRSRDYERPQHQVNIQPFFMGKFPVTQEQYEVITGKNPSYFTGNKRPVEKVSWYDAVEFFLQLSKLTGNKYRLPSEAEWEYACRAGTTTPFHFGKTITTDLANCNGNYTYGVTPKGVYREETTDVKSFPANPFGLYDMHGNVWEWCLDDWHRSYQGAPIDGSAWLERNNHLSQKKGSAILRGGSWYDIPDSCRCASRDDLSSRDSHNGIRRFSCGVCGREDLNSPFLFSPFALCSFFFSLVLRR
ncbi:MAG: formylglycine-generating enzyme family protein, partial [Rivularia sp. (in: cyanobacteria)]